MPGKGINYSLVSCLFAIIVALVYRLSNMSSLLPSPTLSSSSIQMNQVVCFGDSITQQSWSHSTGLGAALADVYQRKMDVINRGLSGYNTLWAIPIAKKWLPLKGEDRPTISLMTIWFGANDAACHSSPQGVSIEDFKTNLHTLIDLVKSPSSPYYSPQTEILLLTPPPVDAETRNSELESRQPPRPADRDSERTRAFANAVVEVGKESGLNVVDTWKAITVAAEKEGGLQKYLSDGLHLSAEGYKVVTYEVMETIRTKLPHLHWDSLEQVFPHWASIVNEGTLGPEYMVKQ